MKLLRIRVPGYTERQAERERKMHAKTFWKKLLVKGAAVPSVGARRSARAPWVTPEAAAARERALNWKRLRRSASANAASVLVNGAGCKECKGDMSTVVTPRRDVNGGYGYYSQCIRCLHVMYEVGWGDEKCFAEAENREICALLNALGAPFNGSGAPSAMHFYKSALHFYDKFSTKSWSALVSHIQSEFATTTSAPCSALSGYRGWYHVPSRTGELRR